MKTFWTSQVKVTVIMRKMLMKMTSRKRKEKNNCLEKGRLEVTSTFNKWCLILWSQISLSFYSERDELDYFLHFLPQEFIKTVLLSATNSHGHASISDFQDKTFEEFIKVLDIFYAMEVHCLSECT